MRMTACGQTKAHLPHWMHSVRFPDRDFQGDVALFPLRGAGGEGAVDGHGADGQVVAFEDHHRAEDVLDELRRVGGDRRAAAEGAGDFGGDFHFVQVAQGAVDASKFCLHHGFAALAVGLLDRLLDLVDGLFARQNAGDGEEAGLHDGVDAPAHAGLLGHFVGVDDVEACSFLSMMSRLHFVRQVIPDFIRAVDAVEQEDRRRVWHSLSISRRSRKLNWWQATKLACADQVGRADRFGAKAQVRDGHRAGFLRVVDEVTLGVIVGFFADDLDRVLVGADGAIRAQAEEDAAHGFGVIDAESRGRKSRLVWVTSSLMPTVKWFFGSAS